MVNEGFLAFHTLPTACFFWFPTYVARRSVAPPSSCWAVHLATVVAGHFLSRIPQKQAIGMERERERAGMLIVQTFALVFCAKNDNEKTCVSEVSCHRMRSKNFGCAKVSIFS